MYPARTSPWPLQPLKQNTIQKANWLQSLLQHIVCFLFRGLRSASILSTSSRKTCLSFTATFAARPFLCVDHPVAHKIVPPAENRRPKVLYSSIHCIPVLNSFSQLHFVSSIPRGHNNIIYSITCMLQLHCIPLFPATKNLKHCSLDIVEHICLDKDLDDPRSSSSVHVLALHTIITNWTACATCIAKL